MEEARIKLGKIIEETKFKSPVCPIVQCVDGKAHTNPDEIKANLIKHITHPVLWTTMVYTMNAFGIENYYECGPDDTLQKIVKRMYPEKNVLALADIESFNNNVTNFKTV